MTLKKKINMQYKILIVKNRTKETIKIQRYVTDWFSKYTPLEIEVNVIETDFDVTPQFVGNQTYKGVICSEDIIPKLRTVIPENKYNAVVLYVGNDLDGIRVSVSNGDKQMFPLYSDTELIQLRTISDSGKDLNHELFHSFFQKARKCQIDIKDPMDTYLRDSDLTVDNIIDTNREIALKTLAPYWNQICSFRNIIETPVVASSWKYFKPGEFTNAQKTHTVSELKKELVDILDLVREDCGFPFRITSGYRTIAENNALAESVTDSSHTTREAVDIVCLDSEKRQLIHDMARKHGINRIGLGGTFVHLDISKIHPQNRTWLY